jgi:hypothetical protein
MSPLLRTTTIRGIPKRVLDRLVMQPLVQRMLLPFGRDVRDKRWVFILGCYNSGTTLLAEMLQSHPAFGGLPNEGAFLTDVLPYPERFGWPRMWVECADKLRISPDDHRRALRIRRQWSLWLRGDSPYVVEKSVSNVLRIDFLASQFEQAHFVYIVRNGYAVAQGIRRKANLRRWKNPLGLQEYPIEMCARQWAETDRVVRSSPHFPDRIHVVRYEELTEDPTTVMNELWRSLGADELGTSDMWRDLQVHEVRSDVKNMNARSLQQLTAEDVRTITSVCADELERYGYTADV